MAAAVAAALPPPQAAAVGAAGPSTSTFPSSSMVSSSSSNGGNKTSGGSTSLSSYHHAQAHSGHAAVSELVSAYLRGPDDLAKIGTIRKKLAQESASIVAKLRSGAVDQLDATRDGLLKLRDTRAAVTSIREQMVNVERLCEDPKTNIEGFSKISEVSRVHRQFVRTLEMVESLRTMYDKITWLEGMLAQEQSDPLGPAPNLLAIHYHVTELESFRNETIHQAKKATPESRATLEKYFGRLNGLLKNFEEHYLRLAGSLVEIARAGHPGVAVKVAKIAEVEGARDEKAIAIRIVKKQNKEFASKFKSMQAESRQIKHYRAKVLEAIRNTAKTRLHEQHVRMSGNSAEFFSSLDWFYEDLVLVEDQLAQRFPPDWKIYTQFVKAYHKSLYDFVRTMVEAEPEAASLLYLSQFCKEYYKNMTKELSIPPELIEPKLLDGKEADLIDEYVAMIRKKMDEWTANLMKTEIEDFTKRESEPEVDADGQYLMQGAPIMFQMINQQTDLALDSNQGAVLAKVVEEFNGSMRSVQSQWLKLIDSEFQRQVRQPDQAPPGLVEYLVALANDQVKSADFTEGLSNRLEQLVSEKYRVQIADKLNDAMDGYLDVAKRCIQILIDTVFNDIKPAVNVLFTPSWYVDEPIHQIVETVADYMSDFQSRLSPSLFDLLVDDIIDTFLITYLAALKRASKLKMPSAVNTMKEDIKKAFEFFTQYKPANELSTYFECLDDAARILSASKTMFYLDYHAIAQKHGTASTQPFVETVLRARSDLDKSDVKGILESIKRRAPEPEPEYPSIFSRLPAEKSVLGGALNMNVLRM